MRVPSKDFAAYKGAFAAWAAKNKTQLGEARDLVRAWNSPLEVKMIIAFERSRLVSKQGQMKVMDASNRVKIAHDLLAAALGIDDKVFVSCPVEKVDCGMEPEQIVFIIRPHALRSLSDIKFVDTQADTQPA